MAVVHRHEMGRDEAAVPIVCLPVVHDRAPSIRCGDGLHLVDSGRGQIHTDGPVLPEHPVEQVVVVSRTHDHAEHEIATGSALHHTPISRVPPCRLTRESLEEAGHSLTLLGRPVGLDDPSVEELCVRRAVATRIHCTGYSAKPSKEGLNNPILGGTRSVAVRRSGYEGLSER